jgi:hypothetical protein
MTGPSTDIGRDLVLFADPQTTFKTAAADYPVAADAVRVITASVNGKSPFAMFADKRGTSTALGIIDQKRTSEFSLECYAYVADRGTAPDWADLLTSGGWQLVSNRGGTDTSMTGGGSTTVIHVTGSGGFVVGDAVIFETGNGTGAFEIRRVTELNAGGANRLSVTPALLNAPTAGATVKGAIMYKPKDAKDTVPDALTLWAMNNNSADRVIGGVIGSQSISMGGDEAARITFSGTGRQDNRMVQTTLATGGPDLNASDVVFTVSDGLAIPSDATGTTPYYFQIDSEVFKVINVSGNSVTVDARASYLGGAVPATHTNGSLMYPYRPTGSYAGTPIPATSGQLLVGGDAFEAGTISIEVDQGIIYRENVHGDAYVVDGYVGGMRNVTATLDGWSFYNSTMIGAMAGRSRMAVGVLAQQGEAEGGILGVELPTFQFEEPDMDRGGDEVTVSLTGQARGTAAETEIYLMVG